MYKLNSRQLEYYHSFHLATFIQYLLKCIVTNYKEIWSLQSNHFICPRRLPPQLARLLKNNVKPLGIQFCINQSSGAIVLSTRGCSPWRPDAVIVQLGARITRSLGFSLAVESALDIHDASTIIHKKLGGKWMVKTVLQKNQIVTSQTPYCD